MNYVIFGFFVLMSLPVLIKPLRCVFFGHKPKYGYCGEGTGYFEIQIKETDGIGRVHASLSCKCERCGEKYRVGMIHVPLIKTNEQGWKDLKMVADTEKPKTVFSQYVSSRCDIALRKIKE